MRAGEESLRAGKIRELVNAQIQPHGPGVAVLIRQNGAVVYKQAFGLADVKGRKPIAPESVFDLASVAKHFTGVAILTLVEAKKIRLADAVANYLPSYGVPVKGRAITISDLLHHVSGLPDYTSDDWDGTDDEFAALTPTTHLEWLNGRQPHRAPGRKFVYNNTEYALLAKVVEQVSCVSFAQYLQEHLFRPARMNQTFVLDGLARPPAERVKGYIFGDAKLKPSSLATIITGDGNIYSSLDDLDRWLAALDSGKVVPAELLALAFKNGRLDNGKPIEDENGNGYGFGWFVAPEGKAVWHSGSWYGTATYITRDLASAIDAVVLSNDEDADVEQLGDSILELFSLE